MSEVCVLIRKSTGDVLNYNAIYPRADMGELIGLDPDLEYLVKHTPFDEPNYDSRIYMLVVNQGPGDGLNEFHPDYPHLRQWRITYSTQKRSDEEIKENVRNTEELANSQVFPNTKQLKYLALGLAVLNRKANGATLTTKEENLLQLIHQKALNIWENDSTMRNKIQLVEAGQEPDLDDGWNQSDVGGDIIEEE